jgi:HEAT repeat protein
VIDWGALNHAYGPADDVPELLADIAAGTEPAAGEAVSELFTLLYHQGGTYSATDAAIPALVDLALSDSAWRPSIIGFLGSLAREDHTHPLIGEHLDRLVDLLDDPDAEVREPAAWLLGDFRGEQVKMRLAERYQTETDPIVRASLLRAVGEADEERGGELAAEALGWPDAPPPLRIAAALVLVQISGELPDNTMEAVVSAYTDGDPLDRVWSWDDGDSASQLLKSLNEPEAMFAVLARSGSAYIRMVVAFALADALGEDRDTDERLVRLLGPLLTDPDRSVRMAAVRTAAQAGRAAVAVVDSLAAAAEPITHGDAPELDPARNALEVLIRVGDPRWRPLLIAAWEHGSAHDLTADFVRQVGASGDTELVAAASARIAAIEAGSASGRVRFNRAASPSSERLAIEQLLASWDET